MSVIGPDHVEAMRVLLREYAQIQNRLLAEMLHEYRKVQFSALEEALTAHLRAQGDALDRLLGRLEALFRGPGEPEARRLDS